MTDKSALAGMERFSFGDSTDMAERLLALVIGGSKTATCWAARSLGPSVVGDRAVVLGGAGKASVIIETTEVRLVRFSDVDAAFAHDEGEGDLSLDWWRSAHRSYFERNGGFADDMELWCERFKVVGMATSS